MEQSQDASSQVSAPGIGVEASGNVTIESGSKSCFKSLGGKNLTISGNSKLSTDTLDDFSDIKDNSSNLTAGGEASISCGAIKVDSGFCGKCSWSRSVSGWRYNCSKW